MLGFEPLNLAADFDGLKNFCTRLVPVLLDLDC